MTELVKRWKLSEFPDNDTIPKFRFAQMVGPASASNLLERTYAIAGNYEKIDFDTGNTEELSADEELRLFGDAYYLIFKDPNEWAYVYSTDLDWGLFFANQQPSELLSEFDFDSALLDFNESFMSRTTEHKAYYNTPVLEAWAARHLPASD